ncbi:hypothetical protein [Terracidiphilus gabretensis]|uniref:hypothetical protein n=1 Tax=Terracidiphilus gabretensis TaxID=1577687 RepID=UPI00071BDC77|nr:hypothetical protein [Terracidiphilus gabretensis]
MTRVETYLRYQDVFGTPSTFEQFEAALRSLDLGLVLRTFAAINVLCSRRGLPRDQRAQVGIIRELFDSATVKRLEESGLPVFHRHQCLFILREAARCCPDVPDMVMTREISHRIGTLALMSNEHDSNPSRASSLEPWSEAWLEQMICDFIPITEANELRFDFASVPRMHKIVNYLAPARVTQPAYFDVGAFFEKASGLPLKLFEALMIGVLPRIMQSAADLTMRSPHYGVHVDFYEQSRLSPAHRDAFLRLLSSTPEELRTRLTSRPGMLSDFTALKEFPFLRTEQVLIPLDTLFCMEKFESSVFWTIYKSLPNRERQNFSSFWGKIFEDYISWLFSNSVDQKLNRFYASPRYVENNEEVCDFIIICGTTALFIECKGGVMLGSAKYGGDPSALRAELGKKYIKPQGVYQVARSITKALRQSQRPLIQGVDLSDIRTVMPVLLTRDDIGDGFFINSYLDGQFTKAKRELNLFSEISPVYCSRLFSMSVDTIEKLSPYLCDTRLAEILAERYMMDPLLLTPFFLKPNRALRSKGPDRPPTLLRAMNDELRDILAEFLNVNRDATVREQEVRASTICPRRPF